MNDGTWAYTWLAGRQLASMSKSGTTVNFAYNADGLRVRKTVVNGMVTDYTLHGKQVVHLKRGGDNLHFFYDAQGRPAIVDFNGVKYGYVHNLQGDVVALIDGSGNQVVEYTYDAWGKPITKSGTLESTLGYVNPFRYRGYVFDEETGLYYLRSRYYSPVISRMLSADSVEAIFHQVLNDSLLEAFALNLFAYANNNPIMYVDPTGYSPWYKIDENYRYRIDNEGTDNEHIHIQGPDNKEWKQTYDGYPYEENNKNTKKGNPYKWIRDLLKKLKDKNNKNKRGGGGTGSGGPGWEWDVTYEQNDRKTRNNSVKAVSDGATATSVALAGGIALGIGLTGLAGPIVPRGGPDEWILQCR